MELNGFQVTLLPSKKIIVIINKQKSATLLDAKEIADVIHNSVDTEYKFCILYRVPGYYFSYNLNTNKGVVLGNSDLEDTIKRTK